MSPIFSEKGSKTIYFVIEKEKVIVYDGRKQVPLKLRDLKNLVGRAGRAGKETKGTIIVTNPKDFATIERLINNDDLEQVKGRLHAIVSNITRILERHRLVLSDESLDAQSEEFQLLLD